MGQIFRKSLLDKLSSPEQLDKMIVITPPSFWIALFGAAIIIVSAVVWGFSGSLPVNVKTQGIYVNEEGTQTVYSDTVGVVSEVLIEDGSQVKKGDVIARLETEEIDAKKKEEEQIRATADGRIFSLSISEGSEVTQGAEVAKLQLGEGDKKIIVCYVPVSSGKKIHEGMKVLIYPSTVNKQEYGHMEAEVIHVDSYITSTEEMLRQLGDEKLVEAFLKDGPVVEIACKIRTSEDTASGYYWSSRKGADLLIEDGTMVEADVVIDKKAPVTILIPYIKEKLTVKTEG